MGFYKPKLLNEYNLNKPRFCLRYADDILAAFGNIQDPLNFWIFSLFTPTRYPTWLEKIQLAFCNGGGVKTTSKDYFPHIT